jgi:5-methylcytosine-specific restriction protein A
VGGEHDINPIDDLIPVCANCHSMLHRVSPALKPSELGAIMNPKTP